MAKTDQNQWLETVRAERHRREQDEEERKKRNPGDTPVQLLPLHERLALIEADMAMVKSRWSIKDRVAEAKQARAKPGKLDVGPRFVQMFGVMVTSAMWDGIHSFALRNHRSVASVGRAAIEEYLANHPVE